MCQRTAWREAHCPHCRTRETTTKMHTASNRTVQYRGISRIKFTIGAKRIEPTARPHAPNRIACPSALQARDAWTAREGGAARRKDMADLADDAERARCTASAVGDNFWTTAGDGLRWSWPWIGGEGEERGDRWRRGGREARTSEVELLLCSSLGGVAAIF
jgi:hypothetical protein